MAFLTGTVLTALVLLTAAWLAVAHLASLTVGVGS